MNDFLLVILIVILVVLPVGSGLLWFMYRKSILLPVALTKFAAAMLCLIGGYAIAVYGFQSLYIIVPLIAIVFVLASSIIKLAVRRPLLDHKKKMEHMALEGDLDIEQDEYILKSKNEIGDIARTFAKLTLSLKNISKFTDNVSSGNLNSELELLSEKDEIGRSLMEMRDSLKQSEEREQQLKIEERDRNWIANGIAKFSEILHMQNSSLKEISYTFISNLVDYVEASQGAIFVMDDDGDDTYYEMMGVVAYDREKNIGDRIKIGEGLVGRCAFERDPIYIKEVPQDYINITSGLGDATPKTIILIPAIMNDQVFAVIEMASFGELAEYKKEFLEKLGETVATSISSIKISEETKKLLESSKEQGERLQMQEEEMRQNMEELEATQEEMNRLRAEEQEKIRELEAKIEELESQLDI